MRLTYLSIFFALLATCYAVPDKTTIAPSPIPKPTLTLVEETVTPDSRQSERSFHDYVGKVATKVGMKDLRESSLADDDIELRIWGGFGLTRLQGFILRRKASAWSSYKIGYAEAGKDRPPVLIEVAEPTSGWLPVWQSMLRHKLLTLPDARAIKCEAGFEDGYSYVVEVKKGANYRTYMYDNPDGKFENRCREADEILAIARIIRDEYDGF